MAKPETLERREVLRLQPLAGAPSSADEAARTVEMVAATETPVAGLVLRCRAGAVQVGPAPVPVLLGHENRPAAMAGRLLGFRFEQRRLIVTAQFTDAPAAEAGWQLARAGCAVSVGATYELDAIEPGRAGDPDVVTKWRLPEVSLVPVGADPLATTRAAESIQTTALEGNTMTASQTKPEAAEATPAPSAAEIRKARQLTREVEKLVGFAPAAAADEIRRAAETEGLQAARAACLDAQRAEQAKAPTLSRGWDPSDEAAASFNRAWDARGQRSIWASNSNDGHQQTAIAQLVERHWSGKAAQPLDYSLRQLGVGGRNALEVVTRALSTTDLPLALTGSGNRQLLALFAAAPQGVRAAATLRQLSDYRAASTLDVGLVGKAQQIKEGGEIKFGSASEQAATYKPSRHGLGLTFTPESLVNDDLAGLDRAIAELGAAMLEAEAVALAELLEGNALGDLAPDGKRLFHADHNNTVAGPLSIASLGQAVAKLRRQTTIGGRFLYQEPGAILCSPDIELTVRQLLSDTLQATDPVDVNPWRALEVAVDPQLGASFVYLLPAGARRPLELGRLTPAPVLESETNFDTGMYRVKSEHAFGCAVVDHRPIVRLTVAGA
ncbi:MAG: hypothetical protein ACNA8O_11870 [Cyanobacteriota bacterium]